MIQRHSAVHTAHAHHGEPGDPVLLGWINDQIDAILGLGDMAMVAVFGAVIVAIPAGIAIFFALHRVRWKR